MEARELLRDSGSQYDLKPENTEYIQAGPITFAVEYRFLYHEDPHGQLTDVLFDQGICSMFSKAKHSRSRSASALTVFK